MPNWVTHRIHVSGPSDETARFFKTCFKSLADQLPDEIEANPECPPIDVIAIYPDGAAKKEVREPIGPVLDFEVLIPGGGLEWGTKWNASQGQIEGDPAEGSFTMRFDTAWSVPEPIFEAIAEQYPRLKLTGYAFDELWRFAAAINVKNGSAIVEEVEPTQELYKRVYGVLPEEPDDSVVQSSSGAREEEDDDEEKEDDGEKPARSQVSPILSSSRGSSEAARTPDRIRILRLLDGEAGLSSFQIKRTLHFSNSRYAEVRSELLRDGLVEKYVCRGGGLRLTNKGKGVAAQGLERDQEEANEDAPECRHSMVDMVEQVPVVDRGTWPAASEAVIEAINRVLGNAAQRFDGLCLTNTKNYFTAHLSGEDSRTRTDWCFWPGAESLLTEIRLPRSRLWDDRLSKLHGLELLGYNSKNGGRYRLKVFPACDEDVINAIVDLASEPFSLKSPPIPKQKKNASHGSASARKQNEYMPQEEPNVHGAVSHKGKGIADLGSAQSTTAAERDARISLLGLLVEHGHLSHRKIKRELNISDQMYDKARTELVVEGLVEQTGKAGGGGLKLAAREGYEASSTEPTGEILSDDSVMPAAEVAGDHRFAEPQDKVEAGEGAIVTLDLARKYLEESDAVVVDSPNCGSVDLDGFTSIDEDAADALGTSEKILCLNGLTTLSDAAAAALNRSNVTLVLNGLTSLSDSAAAALVKHEGVKHEGEASYLSLSGLTNLSDAAAAALAEYKGGLYLDGLTRLSDAAAAALAKHKGDELSLNGLTSLSDAAAAALAKHKVGLSLDGLTSLSDAAAATLAKHEGYLSLDGLTSLSDAAAAALSKHEGGLSLEGLTNLSDAAAAALAKQQGSLCLNGLTSLSDATAAALAKHEGGLYLDGLTNLSDAAAATLAKHEGWLTLRGLTSLSDAAAAALAAHQGSLCLDGLTSLCDAAAVSLANHEDYLSLRGLTSLSDAAVASLAKHKGKIWPDLSDADTQVRLGNMYLQGDGVPEDDAEAAKWFQRAAEQGEPVSQYLLGTMYENGWGVPQDETEALKWYRLAAEQGDEDAAAALAAKHEGNLFLNGLTSLSDAAAAALAEYEGDLYLDGLTSLSDAAAAALAKHEGDLSLDGLTRLSDAAAAALAKHEGLLALGGLTSLSDGAAAALAKHEGDLRLDGLTSLSDEAAAALAKHEGDLYLYGLTSLSDAAVTALAKHEGDLRIDGLTSLSDAAAASLAEYEGDLYLGGLTSLSDGAAAALAKHEGNLFLNGLTSLSDRAAAALAKHEGEELHLDGLTSLSDAAAAAFAKHEGDLRLDGLTSLSDAAAAALAKHEGLLSLDGLTSLSDAAAAALAKHDDFLSLDGLTSLSDAAAAALAKHESYLSLDGLTSPSDAVEEYRSAAEQEDAVAQSILGSNSVAQDNAEKQVETGRVSHKDGFWTALAKSLVRTVVPAATQVLEDSLRRSIHRASTETELSSTQASPEAVRRAAEQGDPDAQYNFGNMCREGQGVPKDERQAVKWYWRSAEQGNANAQYNLGIMYENGVGVSEDQAEAVKWYLRAAEQGHADAQYNSGCMYREGRGVPEDAAEAAKWYRRAAEGGIIDAQYMLGTLYLAGQGVAQDYDEAEKWLRQAAHQGDSSAQELLRNFFPR